MKTKKQNSFELGWSQVPRSQTHTVTVQIMKALDIKAKASFYFRLHGGVEPTISEAKKIEKIFASINITEVWGNAKRY